MFWILRSNEEEVFFLEKGKVKSLCFEKGDIKKSIPLSKKSFNALKGMAMGIKKPVQTTCYFPPKKSAPPKKFEMIEEIFE